MSKYQLAKDALVQLEDAATQAVVDFEDALEALLVTAIADFGKRRGGEFAKGFLQYEVDSISSGGVHEIQRR